MMDQNLMGDSMKQTTVPIATSLAQVAALLRNGEVTGALADLHALDAVAISDPQVEYLFGVAHLQRNDGVAAAAHLQRCRDACPHEADVHYHLGLAYLMEGVYDEVKAIECFATALMCQPDLFAAAYELGRLYKAREQWERALECLIRAANIAAEQDHLEEATLALNEALVLCPDSPELLVFLGRLLLAQERFEHADAAFRQALRHAPGNADIYNELGVVAYKLGRDSQAQRYYRRALGIRPVFPQAQNNLGNLHARAGAAKLALKHYRFAVAQLPGYCDAWYNLAREQLILGDRAGARASCERAVETGSDASLARSTLAGILLADGQFTEGWRYYESRVHANLGQSYHSDPRDPARVLPLPSTLDPAALEGRTVLVIPEPSIGDELAFLRFVATLPTRGIDVEYEPSPTLRPLLESRASEVKLRSRSRPDPEYAAIIASGDLPLLLGHDDADPIPRPFTVTPLDDDVAELAILLEDLEPGPILAITWRAGLAADGPHRKALDLADIAKFLKLWPGPVVAVQRAPEPGEIARIEELAGRTVHDFCSFNDDLERMAALLHIVDEYVGVSNTNMHLMASLGNRARVFVKHPGEWRWMVEGTSTPWAPRALLYRERPDCGWAHAWRELIADLAVDYELLAE